VEFVSADLLAGAVGQRIHSLRRLLDEYESSLPRNRCEQFIKGIRIILDAVEAYHAEWEKYLSTAHSDYPAIRNKLLRKTSADCLDILGNVQQELLSLLDSSLRQSPFLIQGTIERAISLLGSPPTFELTLAPSFGYRYGFFGKSAFVSAELAKLGDFTGKDQLQKKAAELPKWTFFLVYPIVERESALHQVVLAHELAHLVDELHDIHSKLLTGVLDKDSFNAFVEEVEQRTAAKSLTHEDIENRCYQQCSAVLDSWLREIVSDILAVHALGPAYFFSFLEFFANAAYPDEPDADHPAPSYRGAILVRELDHLGFLGDPGPVQRELSAILGEMERSAKTAVGKYESPYAVAHKTIEASKESILTQMRAFCTPTA
jgi:hypothetical protein